MWRAAGSVRRRVRMLRPVSPTHADPSESRSSGAAGVLRGDDRTRPSDERADDGRCPACGYDLRGVLSRGERTPTCPECGLEVGDGAALGIGRAGPAWWIESLAPRGVGVGTLARTAVLSAGMAHIPWRLWRSLRPGHARRPGRLALMVVVPWLALAALLWCLAVHEGYWRQSPLIPFGARLQAAFLGAFGIAPKSDDPRVILGEMPLLGFVQPGVWTYVLGQAHRVLLVFVVAMALGSTVAMAFLVSSRRQASVQFGHIARIGAVMLATAPLAAIVARATFLLARHPDVIWLQTVASLAVLVAWLFVWWHFAARDYVGMARPAVIAAIASAFGFLLGVAATTPWVLA